MDTGHYVNLPGVNIPERTEKNHSGRSKVFTVVAVSFGLLCILQSALNVSLRLQGVGFCNKSDLNYSANDTLSSADISVLLLEKDRLAKENRELQASNNWLTRDDENLKDMLRHQQDHIVELQTEKDMLAIRLSEMEQKRCPLGWTLYMSSCYLLSTERRAWRDAKKDCEDRGAHLVIINDKREEDFPHYLGNSAVWIGLKAKQVGRLKTWTWVDGSRLTDFHRIEPPPHDGRSYCAYSKQYLPDFVLWVHDCCGEQHYWVCEKELK